MIEGVESTAEKKTIAWRYDAVTRANSLSLRVPIALNPPLVQSAEYTHLCVGATENTIELGARSTLDAALGLVVTRRH